MLPETLSPQAEYVLASETANAGRVLVSRTQLAGQQQTAAAVAHLTRALEGCKCSRRFAPEEIITKGLGTAYRCRPCRHCGLRLQAGQLRKAAFLTSTKPSALCVFWSST